MMAVTTDVTIGTPVPTPMPTPTGTAIWDNVKRPDARPIKTAGQAQYGDDLAARAFEKVSEFRQGRGKCRVCTGKSGRCSQRRDGNRQHYCTDTNAAGF